MTNIYDCFTYFDKDLFLDLRLNTLDPYAKKFIVTEAVYTHDGSKKLWLNINNFKKFKDKITYLIVDQPPPDLLEFNDGDTEDIKSEKLILSRIAGD